MKLNRFEPSVYRILLLVLAGLVVLGNLGRVIVTDRVAFYIQDIVLALIATWTFRHYKIALKEMRRQLWFVLLGLFILSIVVSVMLAALLQSVGLEIGVAYVVRYLLYATLLPFLLVGLRKKYIDTSRIISGLIGIGTMVAGVGLVQYFLIPDVRFLQLLGYDDHYYRLVSTFFDPPFTAAIIIVAMFFVLSILKNRLAHWALLIVLALALLLTYSRAEYLSFVAGLVVLLIQTRNKLLLALAGVMVVGVLLLPRPASEGARLERVQSIVARATAITTDIQSLDAKTLLIGRGWYMANAQRETPEGVAQSHSSASDNSYLHVLQSVGAVGLAIFLWFLFVILRTARHDQQILPVLVSILVGSFANNVFFYPALMLVFWSCLALLATRPRPVS